MANLVLLNSEAKGSIIVPHRVRVRDRLRVFFGGNELDRRLASGVRPEESVALELRAQELITRRTRTELGQSLRRTARQRDPALSLTRAPVRRQAVAESGDLLLEVADRLLAPAPVAVSGVAKVRVLLSDGCGPLFDKRREGELRSDVIDAAEALEPRTSHEGLV